MNKLSNPPQPDNVKVHYLDFAILCSLALIGLAFLAL